MDEILCSFRLRAGAVECDAKGVRVAGVPLLLRDGSGEWKPRPIDSVGRSLAAIYGVGIDAAKKMSGLDVVAKALNRGEIARAQIATLLLKLPDPGRVDAHGEAELHKRKALLEAGWLAKEWEADDHPRAGVSPNPGWFAPTDGGATDASKPADPKPVQVADNHPPGAAPVVTDAQPPESPKGERDDRAASTPAAAHVPRDERDDAPAAMADAQTQALEQRYDDLHPVDFAKAVMQFGDQMERTGRDLPAPEQAQAAAEYAFLQDRLSFWLAYEYTPPEALGNLRSAAMALYRGAVFAGLATPGAIPRSMLDVAGEVAFFNNAPPPRMGLPAEESEVAPFRVPGEAPREPEGLGGTVENSNVGIVWGQGNKAQGDPFETFVANQDPALEQLQPRSKTFDQFNRDTGQAVSDKTMNTLSLSYIRTPQSIYSRACSYIDAAADYVGGGSADLDPGDILTKTIQLAVPDYTSPTQWRYLYWAIQYGKERGVSIVITRIRN